MSAKVEPQTELLSFSQKLKEGKRKKDKVTKFIDILFNIFENSQQEDVFTWSSDGSGILIHNHVEFSEKILPKYFKHNNFASFIRQLNIYSFKKVKSETCENHYCHEMFRRGRKDLLSKIKRKKIAMKDQKIIAKSTDVNVEKPKSDSDRTMQENQILKKQQQELTESIFHSNQRIDKLTSENEMLAERYMAQHQQIENLKLMVYSSRNQQNNSSLNPLMNQELQQITSELAFPGMPQQFTNLMRANQPQVTSIQHFQVNQSPLQQQQQTLPQHPQLLASQQQQQLMMRQQQQLYEAMRLFPSEQQFMENPGMRFNLPMQGSDPVAFGNLKFNPQSAGEHLMANSIELLERGADPQQIIPGYDSRG
jgi:hypothetical protein